MIAKGNTHDNGARLARYITTGKDGELAELWELRGFALRDITDAFRSVHVTAAKGQCRQPFFHVQVRNPEGETLTRAQWSTRSPLGAVPIRPRGISLWVAQAVVRRIRIPCKAHSDARHADARALVPRATPEELNYSTRANFRTCPPGAVHQRVLPSILISAFPGGPVTGNSALATSGLVVMVEPEIS